MASISLFDRIDSLTDPDRPRLSRREKLAAMFGFAAGVGFMMLATILPGQPPFWIAVCGAFAFMLLAIYSLLFIVPVGANDNETR